MRLINPAALALALAAWAPPTTAQEQVALSDRTLDALVHVVAHEIGHALLREFDLPILGPEEAIADDFATVYVHMLFPDRAEAIVSARADQHLADNQESGVFSEYADDDQRAGRSICLLYGIDPDAYAGLPESYGMTDDEASDCADFGPEVARSWRRVISDYRLPSDARVTEVRITGDDIPMTRFLSQSSFAPEVRVMLSSIDWHSLITLSFEVCDGTAGWSRNGRKITICEDYITRFERQLGD